jgi:hypothetical protein
MHSQTDNGTPVDATAALNGIIALLATAGVSDDRVAAITGRDPRQVRTLVNDEPRESSVIDRARMTLGARF